MIKIKNTERLILQTINPTGGVHNTTLTGVDGVKG